MRFMHLSDLHIGKRVNEFSMLEDQEYILNQILDIARDRQVDGVWIAGDIYDKTTPSAEAVGLFDRFLTKLARTVRRVFLISGNHDSPERLAFGGRLMETRGVHISPVYQGRVEPVELEDEFGKLNVYLLPFLKPAQVRHAFPGETVESYQDAVRLALEAIQGKLAGEPEQRPGEPGKLSGEPEQQPSEPGQRIREPEHQPSEPGQRSEEPEHQPSEPGERSGEPGQQPAWDPERRNVLVAHQFVTGASRCESEEITVGGVDQISGDLFADFDYVALGHIHNPQHVGRETVRYCGTPLKYSFSEAAFRKSVTIVDLRAKGDVEIRTVDLRPLRDMRKIRGTYMELTNRNHYLGTNVEDYLQVTLTDQEDVPEALGKLRSVYPNIMKLEYDNVRTRTRQQIDREEGAEEKTPLELFEELYRLQNNQDMSLEQRSLAEEMIGQIWEGR